MQRSSLTITICALVAGLSFAPEASLQVPQRTIVHDPDRSISSRLLPADSVVTMTREGFGVIDMTVPSVEDALVYAVSISDMAVIGELTDQRTALIEGDSWIGSELSFRAIETIVLNRGNRLSSIDTTWTGGGELVLKNVTVRAGLPWRESSSKRYLLFIKMFGPEKKRPVLMRTPLVVENAHLVNPWQRDQVISKPDVLNGQPLKTVVQLLKRRKD